MIVKFKNIAIIVSSLLIPIQFIQPLCARQIAVATVPANKFAWSGDRYFELIKWNGTWDQAKADAENRGGRLACVKDAAANSIIYNQLVKEAKPAIFIGGERNNANGKWYWVDGTEISFNNWAPGQPDNSR
jgi:hypothetical protein